MKGAKGKFGRRSRRAQPASKSKRTKPHGHAPKHALSGGQRPQRASGGKSPAHASASSSHQKTGSTAEGTVSANRAGYGFLRVEGLKESVFLPPPEMRGVMHGDKLRVKLTRDGSGRWSGTVEQVLERGVSSFLGTVEILGRSVWVNAVDRRLQLRCAIAPADLHGARSGDWVIARITRHAGSASAAQAVIV